MKKTYIFIGSVLLTMIFTEASFSGYHYVKNVMIAAEMEEEEEENEQLEAEGLENYWFQRMRDPATGTVPEERLTNAYYYMKQLQNRMSKAAIPGVQWTERGPNNQGGITGTILVDLNDTSGKTIWAGTGGGLWKTTDITQVSPNWELMNDNAPTIAVSSIVQSPQNYQVMYYANGPYQYSTRGMGVWKSTNGGTTWTQLTATNTSSYWNVTKLLALSNDTLLVATRTGVYRTVNGGTSFTKVLDNGIAGAISPKASDLEVGSNGTLYAGMNGTLHRSYNRGLTWSLITIPVTTNNSVQMELALCNSDTNYVYATVANSSVILKSTDGGNTVTSLALPISGGVLMVDPNNPQNVIVGNLDLYKTMDGGITWTKISQWDGNIPLQNVHADQRYMTYALGSSSIAYFATDGGVYMTTNATATVPVIARRDANFRSVMFYASAMHPDAGSNYFLAGSQDNGTQKFSNPGLGSATRPTGGDGAFCHIDQNQTQYQFASSQFGNVYRSINGGNSFTKIVIMNSKQFINPSDYDDNSKTLYACGNAAGNNFCRWKNATTSNVFDTVVVSSFTGASSFVKVSPNISNRVYFGLENGAIVRVDSANTVSSGVTGVVINSGVVGMTNFVTSIEIEKGNENHILITQSNYGISNIWETMNGGITWTAQDGNLPDLPVFSVLINPSNPDQALVGTELGVWSTDNLNGSSTDWQPSNSGLANTRVTMLKVRPSDNLVLATTYGRGLFSSDVFAQANFTANRIVIYAGQQVQFTNLSKGDTSYAWNFGDGNLSNQKNPNNVYSNPGTYSVTLTINGGISPNKSKTVTNYIKVLPYKAVPYLAANGGDFESNPNDFASMTVSGTAFEKGNSLVSGKDGTYSGGNAWVTGLTQTTYQANSVSYLYTPNFNCSQVGTYTLSFAAKYDFGSVSGDGFRLEYTLDTGTTWLPLEATITAPGWYNNSNNTAGGAFTQNTAYFDSIEPAYIIKTQILSSVQGNDKVGFRFAFRSDSSNSFAGLAIDNFELSGPANNALPATLLQFGGIRKNKTEALLSWTTSSEINASHFELQRKLHGENVFQTVGTIQAKGSHYVKSNYHFTDENSSSYVSYYRLSIHDKDGAITYTNTITVTGNPFSNDKFILALIPSANLENVFFIHGTPQPVYISVMAANGQLIKKLHTSVGESIDLNDLSAGIYYCMFTTGEGQKQMEKVLVR